MLHSVFVLGYFCDIRLLLCQRLLSRKQSYNPFSQLITSGFAFFFRFTVAEIVNQPTNADNQKDLHLNTSLLFS